MLRIGGGWRPTPCRRTCWCCRSRSAAGPGDAGLRGGVRLVDQCLVRIQDELTGWDWDGLDRGHAAGRPRREVLDVDSPAGHAMNTSGVVRQAILLVNRGEPLGLPEWAQIAAACRDAAGHGADGAVELAAAVRPSWPVGATHIRSPALSAAGRMLVSSRSGSCWRWRRTRLAAESEPQWQDALLAGVERAAGSQTRRWGVGPGLALDRWRNLQCRGGRRLHAVLGVRDRAAADRPADGHPGPGSPGRADRLAGSTSTGCWPVWMPAGTGGGRPSLAGGQPHEGRCPAGRTPPRCP